MRWIGGALPLFGALASLPATAQTTLVVEAAFSTGGPRQLMQGESASIAADLGTAFSRIDSISLRFAFDGDLLAEGEDLHVGVDGSCCSFVRHYSPTPTSSRSLTVYPNSTIGRQFLDGVVRIDVTMATGSVFLEQVVVAVTGVLKRPSHLMLIEPDNLVAGATLVDFENLPGDTLPAVPNLRFVRTGLSDTQWFGGQVKRGEALFGEAYLINLSTTRGHYSHLAIEFDEPVEAVGAWVKRVPNVRDESPARLRVVATDPYLNEISYGVRLPLATGKPRFVGFSSEDGIVRVEWLRVGEGWFGADDITFGAFAPLPRPVEIDIRPGSDANRVQVESRGVIAVAILGTGDFDVADVDPETLSFGPDGAAPVHAAGGHPEDVNGDGLTDLVSHYRIPETGLALGDTEACAMGETLDGIPIMGCDSVEVVTPRGMRSTP